MLNQIEAILDSTAFKVFFAIWTGIYLVQIIKAEAGAPDTSELWWIMAAMAVGIFIV